MKRKGPRDIPDFSKKIPQKLAKGVRPAEGGTAPKPPKAPMVKPATTMPKGGRRGG